MRIPGADERWENWMQYTQSRLVKKFTPLGFEVIDTPPHVHKKLIDAVNLGIDQFDTLAEEQDVEAIYGPHRPKFVNIGQLAWEVLDDLKGLHEEWSGLQLKGTSSYGVRLYRNGSSLVMHNDKVT